jgi:hypothetical protein
MPHNELITEFPCDGELVRVEERCTRWLTVLRCGDCTTEDYLTSAVNARVHSWPVSSKVFAGIVPAGAISVTRIISARFSSFRTSMCRATLTPAKSSK